MKKENLAQLLTYAGILPFLGVVIMSIIKPDFLGLNYNYITLTYGAVIASFISGIHWGVYLFKDTHMNLFIHSNIVALLAWFAVVTDISISEGILIACFFYLLCIDVKLEKIGVLDPWYLRMRLNASAAVIMALSLTIII